MTRVLVACSISLLLGCGRGATAVIPDLGPDHGVTCEVSDLPMMGDESVEGPRDTTDEGPLPADILEEGVVADLCADASVDDLEPGQKTDTNEDVGNEPDEEGISEWTDEGILPEPGEGVEGVKETEDTSTEDGTWGDPASDAPPADDTGSISNYFEILDIYTGGCQPVQVSQVCGFPAGVLYDKDLIPHEYEGMLPFPLDAPWVQLLVVEIQKSGYCPDLDLSKLDPDKQALLFTGTDLDSEVGCGFRALGLLQCPLGSTSCHDDSSNTCIYLEKFAHYELLSFHVDCGWPDVASGSASWGFFSIVPKIPLLSEEGVAWLSKGVTLDDPSCVDPWHSPLCCLLGDNLPGSKKLDECQLMYDDYLK